MKRLLFILAGLSLVVFIAILAGIRRSPFGGDNSRVAVPSGRSIDRIVMIRGDQKLILEQDGTGGWTINGEGEARSSAINFILKTVRLLEIRSPVSEEMFREKVIDSEIVPVEVAVYGSGRKRTSFMVYKFSDDPLGNIVKRSAGSKPFIAAIPGWELNPGSHFITDPRFWMPYNIFALSPASIESLTLTMGEGDTPDFMISSVNNQFGLIVRGVRPATVDTTAMERYLAYYSFVPFEKWVFDLTPAEREQITGQTIYCRITLRERDNRITDLKLWRRYYNSSDGMVEDTDRLWGSTNDGKDIFMVRYYDIDPVIKSPDYFISD